MTRYVLGVKESLYTVRAGGGIGRRDGLKSRWAYAREGSSPSLPNYKAELIGAIEFFSLDGKMNSL